MAVLRFLVAIAVMAAVAAAFATAQRPVEPSDSRSCSCSCGATDGWMPHPFLDPRLGYPVIALYCAAITAAVLVLAALVWAASRLHVLPIGTNRS